jgi:rhomboid protease GluP
MPLPPRWRWKLDHWRENAKKVFRSDAEPPRPRLCPACSKLVGVGASKCPECGASMTYSLAAASRSLSRLLPYSSPVTYAFLGLCCLLYGASLLVTIRQGGGGIDLRNGLNLGALLDIGGINQNVLLRMGASLPYGLDLFHPWRLVMASLLHGSLMHIGMNMWGLMYLGPLVEEQYGSPRYLFICVVTGIAGFLLSGLLGHFSIGASASLMGLIGMLLGLTMRRRSAAMQMLRGQLIIWVVYIFISGFMFPGIDNAAHLGGLAAGFVLGRYMEDREPVAGPERKRAYALGWTAGAAIVASFVIMLLGILGTG